MHIERPPHGCATFHGGVAVVTVASTRHATRARCCRCSMAETSWAYTLDDGDDDSNTVPSKVTADNLKKYDISPQGQADEIRMVAEAVNNIGDNDGDGDKTNGANGNKATGVLSKTGSAVTAVGLAVPVLGAAGGVSFALRRKRS